MQYKLINNVTKEETICEKVEIDGFEYYVNNDKITGWYYNPTTNKIYSESHPKRLEVVNKNKRMKIVCTDNPSIDIAQVIDEVKKLAILQYPIRNGKTPLGNSIVIKPNKDRRNFISGYNKAKETYQFTEQDMLDFGKYCINNQLCKEENRYYQYWELLQIFKEQQIKTIFYE